MRKIILLALVFFTSFTAFGQDFSNKGKEFWLCFPTHVPSSNNATLSIYITGDRASTGTITMPNGAFAGTFNIAANGIQEVQIAWATNRHIDGPTESNTVLNKSIRIKTDVGQPPVVAYAQQWAGARSTATLLLPVNVLGTKYYSMNFAQDGAGGGRSQFQIIATKPNTVVEITPVKNGVKEATITINLPLEGDMYQYWSTSAGATTHDLTGTFIESIAAGTGGCKPIAVSSGSSNIKFGTAVPSCTGNSYDPLWQQLYPVATWGKNFGFIPFQDYLVRGNPYRVMAAEDNTNVYFDGALVANLNAGQIYPAAFTNAPATLLSPTSITADKPICVAQYAQADACTGQPGPANQRVGDPDMVILNPIEQNISDITVFSSTNQSITRQYANILIKTIAVPSFRISRNGGPLNPPVGAWQTLGGLPGYSYLRESLTGANSIRMLADSGFNAIAYGWGNVESYAYSAGTNVRDLYQQIGVQTEYGIETTPSVCTNSPFRFKVSLPYCADSIRWDLSLLPGPPIPAVDTIRYNTCVVGPGGPDSITIVNGRDIYWYSLPTLYNFSTIGIYPVSMITYSPNASGCGSEQLIDFDLTISDPPVGSFTVIPGGCYAEPYQFIETTPQLPKTTYHWWYDFGDGFTSTGVRNPFHTYAAPGTYNARYSAITTPGCLSDTIPLTVIVPALPTGTISGNNTVCINTPPGPDITFVGTEGTAPYTFTYTINGGAPLTVNSPGTSASATIQAATNVAGSFIYRLTNVQNVGSTLCSQAVTGQSITIDVLPDHAISVDAGNPNPSVCINTPLTPFTLRLTDGATGIVMPPTNLPPGVTATLVGNIVTIQGTPTLAGTYNYSVTTSGNACLTATFTGTIIVDPDHTISLGGGDPNPIVCINNPIPAFTLTIADGATGIIMPPSNLPPGVTATLIGNTVTIQGIPTAAGTFNYTVTTTGNTCVTATYTGTIIVNPDHTIALDAGNANPTLCVNTVMTSFTLRISDGATGIVMPPVNLPPGVTATLAGNIVTIAGTPTLAGIYNYTVTTSGNACLTDDFTGTITVTEDGTLNLTSAAGTDAQKLCRNATIIPITYVFGQSATGASVTGLPPGVTFVVVGNTVTITGSPTVSLPAAYTYTVSTTGPCVTPSLTGTILVDELPTVDFNYTAPTCDTRTITFTDISVPNTGTLAIWSWDFGDPASIPNNTSNLQNPTHVFSAGPNNYNVTLTVTTSEGCSNAAPFAKIVTVNHRPEAGFIVPEVCINDIATVFTDTSKIAVGAITGWEWDYGDGSPRTFAQHGSHLYLSTGVYDVLQIVTSNNGCKDSITLQITINSADPVAAFNITNSGTLCSSDSVSLVNQSTVGFGNVTRLEIYWDNVGTPAVFETINTPVFNEVYKHKYATLPTSQNYVIRMIAYSGTICLNQTTRNITVHANPIVQFNPIPDACLLIAPYQITQGSEIGGVPGTGTYSGPGIINPNGLFDPAIAGIGTHTIRYTWTASNPGACIDTLDRTITVRDTAHAVFSFVSPTCESVPASFTDLSTAPATVVLANTIWNFGDGSPNENHAPGSTFGHLFPGFGTYTVTMYNVSDYGCNSTPTSQSVTVDPDHTILTPANNIQTRCINTAIAPMVYTLGGGATGANVVVGGLPPGVTYTVAGTQLTISGAPTSTAGSPYNFTLETTGNTCIRAQALGSITVDPDHAISLRAGGDTAQSVCVNTPIDPIEYDLGGGAAGATISNLPTGITYTVTGNILRISGTPTATNTVATSGYTITTNGNTCQQANAIGQIVVHPYPVPGFTIDKPAYCIPNAIVKFTNTSTTPDGSSMLYDWTFGDGPFIDHAVHPTHWYTSGTGPFTVTLLVTSQPNPVLNSGPGCQTTINVPMTAIHPQPKADFVFSKPAICIGDNVTITDNTDGRDGIVNSWTWDLGDGSTRNTSSFTYTYGDTITYNVKLFSVNSFGCNSDTVTKPFTVYPYPHVNAGPDRFIVEGGTITLDPVLYGNDMTYLWTPNLYLIDNTAARVKVNKPLSDMTYRLTVTVRGGCASSDDVFIKLLKFPVIPNTFTPNNDGINDTWRIDYLNTYPNNRVQIFTRTGQLVFESRGYDTPWDGTLKGKPMPIDTYYYIIEPGNGRDPITGYVTILK